MKNFLIIVLIFTLTACGGSEKAPIDITSKPSISLMPDPGNRLLNDAELKTLEDPNAPVENPIATQWIEKNHHTLRSIHHDGDFSDLAFLDQYLQGRSLVQLGESGHGISEHSTAKVRLIKYLHQHLGFNVLAFEYTLFNANFYDKNPGELTPKQLLVKDTFYVWQTKEVIELFEYAQSTRSSSHPLHISGIDNQMLWSMDENLAAFNSSLIEIIDPSYAISVRQTIEQQRIKFAELVKGEKTYAAIFSEVAKHEMEMRVFWQGLADFFEKNAATFTSHSISKSQDARLARQVALAVLSDIDRAIVENNGSAIGGFRFRDKNMAENVRFLLEDYYRGEKIMVWAHNYHVSHAAEELTGGMGERSMGSWLKEWFRDRLYTIGFYAYRGNVDFFGTTSAVLRPQANSIESIFYRTRKRYSFVDLISQTRQPGTGWMFDPKLRTFDDGKYLNQMQLRNQFDAILFIDTVTPAQHFE